MRHAGYPSTPLLDQPIVYKRATIEALQRFKATDPWRRAPSSRTHKFNTLLKELRAIYGKPYLRASYRAIHRPFGDSGGSHYDHVREYIVMEGRFSVVTFLHEFAHALGKDEYGATRWSTNLFAQVFPEKMANLIALGHMLVARDYQCHGCLDRRAARAVNFGGRDCSICRRNPTHTDNRRLPE